VTTTPLYDEFGVEIHAASQPGKAFALLEDETRVNLIASAVYIVGNESIKQPNGTMKDRYAVGLQFDSLRALRYEDGIETGRTHSWFKVLTFSYHEKSTMATSGLAAVLAIPKDKDKLTDFIKAALGKQLTARIKHRKYEVSGETKIATDLEAFKPIVGEEDFKGVIASFVPHRQAIKRYPTCKFVSVLMKPPVAQVLSEYMTAHPVKAAAATTTPVEVK
jgi:hypothetical protein